MPEGDDEDSVVIPNVLEVVDRAGRDVKHLACSDGEIGKRVRIPQDADERLALDAIAQLDSIRMPMRLSDGTGREREPPDGKILQDRKLLTGYPYDFSQIA
jgi:hypothetical protein